VTAFSDTNVPVFASGREHLYREPCVSILVAAAAIPGKCVTSAEVLQEIFHLYFRRGEAQHGRLVLNRFDRAIDGQVADVTRQDVMAATEMNDSLRLQSRDRLHVAIMRRLGITDIITADAAFGAVPGIRRLDPIALHTWRDEVFAPPV
jgi:predicted nucleic acid-binding protein